MSGIKWADRLPMIDIPCVKCGKLRHVRSSRPGKTGLCGACVIGVNGRNRHKARDYPPALVLECPSCHRTRLWHWEGLKAWRRYSVQECMACFRARWALPSDEECADWEEFDVDWAVVARFIQGKGGSLTSNRLERQLAVVVLTRRGWGAKMIAGHMGISDRTVIRLRRHQRLQPVSPPSMVA